jgi:hypothetical protein
LTTATTIPLFVEDDVNIQIDYEGTPILSWAFGRVWGVSEAPVATNEMFPQISWGNLTIDPSTGVITGRVRQPVTIDFPVIITNVIAGERYVHTVDFRIVVSRRAGVEIVQDTGDLFDVVRGHNTISLINIIDVPNVPAREFLTFEFAISTLPFEWDFVWQPAVFGQTLFTGLDPSTDYYIYARLAFDQVGTGIFIPELVFENGNPTFPPFGVSTISLPAEFNAPDLDGIRFGEVINITIAYTGDNVTFSLRDNPSWLSITSYGRLHGVVDGALQFVENMQIVATNDSETVRYVDFVTIRAEGHIVSSVLGATATDTTIEITDLPASMPVEVVAGVAVQPVQFAVRPVGSNSPLAWQISTTFTNLAPYTTFEVFARSAQDANNSAQLSATLAAPYTVSTTRNLTLVTVPTPTFSAGSIGWQEVVGAQEYVIMVGGVEVERVGADVTSFRALQLGLCIGVHQVSIVAIGASGEYSQAAPPRDVVISGTLAAPFSVQTAGNVIVWNRVGFAEGYHVYVNGFRVSDDMVTGNVFTLPASYTGTFNVQVRSVSNAVYWRNSGLSAARSMTV